MGNQGAIDKAAAVEDRVGSIRAFAVHMGNRDSTRDLVRQIEMVFRDRDRAGVLTLYRPPVQGQGVAAGVSDWAQ